MLRLRVPGVALFLLVVATPSWSIAQTRDAMAAPVTRARQDLEATTRGCFERGWGTQTAYSMMTFAEAVPRSGEFAALHRQRARELSACALAAEQALTRYRSVLDDFKAKLLVLSKDAEKTRLVSQALDMSANAISELIRTTFPKAVRLEHRLSEFFTLLRQIRPSSSTSVLEFPQDVVRLETEIVQAMRVQSSAAARYLEAMHILFPSPALRTRLTVTRILDVMYRATVEVMSADERAQPRAFRQLTEALTRAQAMAQSEAQAADIQRIRGVVASYIEMVGHFESVLADMREIFRGMDENLDGLTPGELAVSRQRYEKLTFQMETALERIEKLAVRIDGEATECMGRKC